MWHATLIATGALLAMTAGKAASAKGMACHPGKQAVAHVLVIVLENQEADDVRKSPGFASIAAKGATFTRSSGVAHPSYPNYLALVGVQIHKTTADWSDHQRDLADSVPSIINRLEEKNLSWKSYVEDYPVNDDRTTDPARHCGAAKDRDPYVRRHVPLLSFDYIEHSREHCERIVDASEFKSDIKGGSAFPSYAFYTPNLCHDGHGAPSCGFGSFGHDEQRLGAAEKWLTGFLDDFDRTNHALKDQTLIVVTFDESDNYLPDHNQIFTMFVGGMVKPGSYDAPISHYRVLRTIEDRLGICPVGAEGNIAPITSVWK